ncbi:helix-turn-helix domain-containing protein [Streptomyces sp. NPDC020875]|uniref:helix-turn-helix domain-containing protein n=1 Tax=Streptomyces sp. NPDC020875 TaxID=3154898 RepID=UPI0034102CEE
MVEAESRESAEPRRATELRSYRALAHPLRLRLLSLLTGAPLSSAEAARELGETQANISYHIRLLYDAGLLELAEETTVRGGRAKRYRHPVDGPALPAGGPEDHVAVASALASEMVRRSGQRIPGLPGDLTDAELTVRPETWERARALAAELGRIVHEEALPPGTEGAVRMSATVLLFRMAENEDQGEPETGGKPEPDADASGDASDGASGSVSREAR